LPCRTGNWCSVLLPNIYPADVKKWLRWRENLMKYSLPSRLRNAATDKAAAPANVWYNRRNICALGKKKLTNIKKSG
ncbi:MAG TPA: hypothetical protein VLS94_12230, partial [Fusibacter sp.]|nr:hypothetical protein [Fusibacter sp.]